MFKWIMMLCFMLHASICLASGGSVSGLVQATPARFLPETVVYLKNVPGNYAPTTATLDQQKMQFIPHVLTITTGDTVTFLNSDDLPHDVFSPSNEKYRSATLIKGQTFTHLFNLYENVAYTQLCDFHPSMLAFIFVGQNPYTAIPDNTGHYTINNIPPGTYEIAVWNSRLKTADQNVSVSEGALSVVNFLLHR